MEYEIRQTKQYQKWLRTIDHSIKKRIAARLILVEGGNFGDNKYLGDSISELRFHFAGGPRIYYTVQGLTIVLLLIGGDKSSQENDIKRAKKILKEIGE